MNSNQIQQQVLDWAYEQNFTAPYGVVDGKGRSPKGKMYLGVTFGYARTLDANVRIFNDANVRIFNRNFMIYESSAGEREIFADSSNLMTFLKERFG